MNQNNKSILGLKFSYGCVNYEDYNTKLLRHLNVKYKYSTSKICFFKDNLAELSISTKLTNLDTFDNTYLYPFKIHPK